MEYLCACFVLGFGIFLSYGWAYRQAHDPIIDLLESEYVTKVSHIRFRFVTES
jgi:hypothetical protein